MLRGLEMCTVISEASVKGGASRSVSLSKQNTGITVEPLNLHLWYSENTKCNLKDSDVWRLSFDGQWFLISIPSFSVQYLRSSCGFVPSISYWKVRTERQACSLACFKSAARTLFPFSFARSWDLRGEQLKIAHKSLGQVCEMPSWSWARIMNVSHACSSGHSGIFSLLFRKTASVKTTFVRAFFSQSRRSHFIVPYHCLLQSCHLCRRDSA